MNMKRCFPLQMKIPRCLPALGRLAAGSFNLRSTCLKFFCLLFSASHLAAQDWTTFTSMYDVMDMTSDGSSIWCGTTGGLLAFDPATHRFTTWTNTRNLSDNNATAVTADHENRIWIGFENGQIQRYNPIEDQWLDVGDYNGHAIHHLVVQGDTLWVGLDIGLSLYQIARREVKETYRRLGAGLSVDIPVRRILVTDQSIWAVTDEGAAFSGLENVNLLDPQNWTTVTQQDGLTGSLTSIAEQNDAIYTGTSDGVFAATGDQWVMLAGSDQIGPVRDLITQDGDLTALTTNGVYRWNGGQWNGLGPGLSGGRRAVSVQSDLWVGTDQGLALLENGVGSWATFRPNTPHDNRFADVAVAPAGELWCGTSSYLGSGFSRFDGQTWTIYDQSVIPNLTSPGLSVIAIAFDQANTTWLGSWGGGLIRIFEDNTIHLTTTQGGRLSGIPEDLNYAVVSGMAMDDSGVMWLLNYAALSRQGVVAVTPEDVWTYFGENEGITSTFLRDIAVDNMNRKWIGSDMQGVFILDDNGTPADHPDDPPVGRITTSHGLESNRISGLAPDRDNGMWIGTPEGLYFSFQGSVQRRYGLPSDNVTALAVDGANNLWVGTNLGVSMFSSQTFIWTHYSTANSSLVNNDVVSLDIDMQTGTVYIGTSHGLSRLTTPFSAPSAELETLNLYPNPFIPDTHGSLTIDNLAQDVVVHIFTAGGQLVRRFNREEIPGRSLHWNGADMQGLQVPGGIYLVVASLENGDARMVKIAVLR